jgi:dTDP-4-amino-4,6-dideoxygalactose transaminase
MCSILLEVGPDDEVIMPSYTFVSTANAFRLRGARPVFVDIRPDTLNMDETLLEAAITPETTAIVPVHYAGVACEMGAIMEVSARHGVPVVEDAAQGVDATWNGRFLGTMGDLGTYSFHETKNVMCGEGGALLVNNEQYLQRAEIILEKGTNRAQFLQRMVDKYTWVDVGSSYLPSDMLAAFLYGQLEQRETIKRRRRQLWEAYAEGLTPLAERGLIELQEIPRECGSNHHMFFLLVRDPEERTALIAHLEKGSINAVFHYVPLHTSPMGRKLGYRPGDLPVTERQSGRVLRLPMYATLTSDDQRFVIDQIHRFYACTHR